MSAVSHSDTGKILIKMENSFGLGHFWPQSLLDKCKIDFEQFMCRGEISNELEVMNFEQSKVHDIRMLPAQELWRDAMAR